MQLRWNVCPHLTRSQITSRRSARPQSKHTDTSSHSCAEVLLLVVTSRCTSGIQSTGSSVASGKNGYNRRTNNSRQASLTCPEYLQHSLIYCTEPKNKQKKWKKCKTTLSVKKTRHFLQAGCSSRCPTNNVKAWKANKKCHVMCY